MTVATDTFAAWLEEAAIPVQRLTPEQQALLQAAFRFRQRQGADYYSTRLLSHFLLHAQTGLKVAQIARLLGISRPTASGHQDLSSKQVIQQAHHRLDGRPYGKLLPRFAGPIANFILSHPSATRFDLLDFIQTTFSVRVSRIALYKFLKKYGLDQISGSPAAPAPAIPPTTTSALAELLPAAGLLPVPALAAALPAPDTASASSSVDAACATESHAPAEPGPAPVAVEALPQGPVAVPVAVAVPAAAATATPANLPVASLPARLPVVVPAFGPAPPFSTDGRNTRAPSC
jgi:hypothetical protein